MISVERSCPSAEDGVKRQWHKEHGSRASGPGKPAAVVKLNPSGGFAIGVHIPSATGRQGANAVALAEDFRNDVLVARGTASAGGQLPPDATGMRVDGADVRTVVVR
jgi:hypothetical protein